MDWIVRHHEALLLWMTAIAMEATSITCYHSPVLGVVLKVAALMFVITGVVVMKKEDEEYDED